MARFPAQGSGGDGGAGTGHVIQDEGSGLAQQPILDFQGDGVEATDGTGKTIVTVPGQSGGVVEKLFDTTLTSTSNDFDAVLPSSVNLSDYSEFWLIINGACDLASDIFVQINNNTSTSYETSYNWLDDSGPSSTFSKDIGVLGWTVSATEGTPVDAQIQANTLFYAKLVIQGADNSFAGDSAIRGSIFASMRGGAFTKQGSIFLTGFGDSTLSKFRIFTGGSPVMKIGTQISIFGVKITGIPSVALTVEKLFEDTIVTPATSLPGVFPAVNLVDYAEFWFIMTGSLSADDDILGQINNLTSSSYSSTFTRIQGVVQTIVDAGGSTLLELNDRPTNDVLANTQFYCKVVLQGGNPVGNKSRGSIFCKYAGSGGGSAPNNWINGGIDLDPFSDTTLFQFILSTRVGANLNAGTKLSIYGVRTA